MTRRGHVHGHNRHSAAAGEVIAERLLARGRATCTHVRLPPAPGSAAAPADPPTRAGGLGRLLTTAPATGANDSNPVAWWEVNGPDIKELQYFCGEAVPNWLLCDQPRPYLCGSGTEKFGDPGAMARRESPACGSCILVVPRRCRWDNIGLEARPEPLGDRGWASERAVCGRAIKIIRMASCAAAGGQRRAGSSGLANHGAAAQRSLTGGGCWRGSAACRLVISG